jgi:hypothetical protein
MSTTGYAVLLSGAAATLASYVAAEGKLSLSALMVPTPATFTALAVALSLMTVYLMVLAVAECVVLASIGAEIDEVNADIERANNQIRETRAKLQRNHPE